MGEALISRTSKDSEIDQSEGEWTPDISCYTTDGSEAVNPTYTTNNAYGYYRCFGDFVYLTFKGSWHVTNVGTGYARVVGLPFEAAGDSTKRMYSLSCIVCYGLSRQAGNAVIKGGTSDIKFYTGSGEVTQSWYLDDETAIGYSGWYIKKPS